MTKNISILCVTGNPMKFALGKHAFAHHGMELVQSVFDFDEIQGEDPELIIKDKAAKAFALVGKPLIVTDDSWSIPALGGFPGAYMKSMNHWLTPEDMLHFISHKSDRTIILQQYLAYIDEHETVVFSKDIAGVLVDKPRGNSGPPVMKVVSFHGPEGLTISERFDADIAQESHHDDAWNDLAAWYKQKVNL